MKVRPIDIEKVDHFPVRDPIDQVSIAPPRMKTSAVISATAGTVVFSILSTAFFLVRMTVREFALLALATVLAFLPSPATMAAPIAIFVAVYFWQRKRVGVSTKPGADQQVEIATK